MKHHIDNYIRLEPISLTYRKAIFSSFDHEVIRYLPLDNAPERIEDTEAFIKHSVEQMQEGVDLVWVILHKNEFAGCCGIHNITSKQPHFGIWLKTEVQGKGIGKKVVHYVLQWGISHLDVDFIKYPVDERNTRSIQLIKELNLKQENQYKMGGNKKLNVIEYRLYKL